MRKAIFYSAACICLINFATAEDYQSDHEYLDKLALEYGADKGSYCHNYMETYAHYFGPFKNKPIRFLEIGICGGSSARVWDQYFPNAELHFIDIEPGVLKQSKPQRAHYHILDQADPVALEQLASNLDGKFDIIIDDGGHYMDQQIISFQTLFPHLSSGGLYIIEDLHTSYWKVFGGGGDLDFPKAGPGTTIEFLKNLVEDLNYTAGATGYGDWRKTPENMREALNDYQRDIHSVCFFKSLCVIKKR